MFQLSIKKSPFVLFPPRHNLIFQTLSNSKSAKVHPLYYENKMRLFSITILLFAVIGTQAMPHKIAVGKRQGLLPLIDPDLTQPAGSENASPMGSIPNLSWPPSDCLKQSQCAANLQSTYRTFNLEVALL